MTAPIALFAYNRLRHLKETLAALQRNELAEESDLFIFADGLRKTYHSEGHAQVREFLKQDIHGFRNVEIFLRNENYGLSKNIINGVTQLADKYGEVIVLEDDILTSKFFLRYMNDALDVYRDQTEVISIHGYIYPVTQALPETFFLRGADCWGWATWQRGWELFEPDGVKLLNELRARHLTREFDYNNTYPFTRMLVRQITGKNDSWAVRWYASAFLKNKLTLYPGQSMVHNIGNDGSGVHSHPTDVYDNKLPAVQIQVIKQSIAENIDARKAIAEFFRHSQLTLWQSALHKITKILKSIFTFV